jgi:hypothetical protein
LRNVSNKEKLVIDLLYFRLIGSEMFQLSSPIGNEESSMKASKFMEAQLAFVLKKADEGIAVSEACHKTESRIHDCIEGT